MNLNQLKKQFPDERSCREFFEFIRWPSDRLCPHCGDDKSWLIKATAKRPQRYECARCRRQFTVTTKTALHSTKLPLWTWLLSMYLITSSSKGVASTVLAGLIGTTQPTAWKIGHVVRKMMDSAHSDAPLLKGVVELDETYVGGNPAMVPGVKHKRGKGTTKQ
jgi:transposase-like protein